MNSYNRTSPKLFSFPGSLHVALAALAALLFGVTPLWAAPITWTLDYEFSGATPPVGTLYVNLTDTAADTVRLTVDATALQGSEFVSELYLNFDPSRDPLLLTLTDVGGPYSINAISVGANAFKADGDGKYDILIDFAPPGNKLGAGEEARLDITGIEDLSEDWFEFLSAPAGGHGPFLVAAHVQGIGDDGEGSGWVTTRDGDEPVPEASTMLLFGSGAIGLFGYMRRKGWLGKNS